MFQKIGMFLIFWNCSTLAADILMATQGKKIIHLIISIPGKIKKFFKMFLGGTKSHKIPFWELAKGLISRYLCM